MKKLIIVLFCFLYLTGCGYNKDKSIISENENKTTSSISTNSTSISKTSTLPTTTSKVSKEVTSKTTEKTIKTTKKITTSNRVTNVKVTTNKTTTSTSSNLTEEEVRKRILSLKKEYPDGTSWTNENRKYKFKASNMTNYVGHGCAAFAYMASDIAFGTVPVKKLTTFDTIRTGDIIRYLNDTHSVIVLEIKKDKVIVAEGNIIFSDGGGVVHWGRSIDIDEIKKTGTYIYTRWA